MDRFSVRGEAADSVAEYLRYREIVGDEDGGKLFTEEEYTAFKARKGIVDRPLQAQSSQPSEAEVMAIYEQRYQARRKAEKARLKPGEKAPQKYAIALNMPPMHLMDALALEDDGARPRMPWDLPDDSALEPPARQQPVKSSRARVPLSVGDRVDVISKNGSVRESGVLRFVGTAEFGEGEWMGVELDAPNGRNDGSVDSKRYFTCKADHGLFVKPARVVYPL